MNLTEYDEEVNGKRGSDSRSRWDFDDETGYITYEGYKLMDDTTENMENSLKGLRYAQSIVRKIVKNAKEKSAKHKAGSKEKEQYDIIHRYHKRPNKVAEMRPETGFYGMNKPYRIKYESNSTPLGPKMKRGDPAITDVAKKLRAESRVIYLLVRNKSKSFIRDLVIHELAHTVANHVIYRASDHGEDFERAEEIVKSLNK